jgi:hypothetical protein
MKPNTTDIKRLIDLFMEGETNLEQERTLYSYFAISENIPSELEVYKEMFQGFASIDQSASKIEQPIARPTQKRISLRNVIIYAAASVALLAGIFLLADKQEEKQLESLYAGSYMIIDGKRIDDLQKIKPDIDRILAYAEQMEQSTSISSHLQSIEEGIIE